VCAFCFNGRNFHVLLKQCVYASLVILIITIILLTDWPLYIYVYVYTVYFLWGMNWDYEVKAILISGNLFKLTLWKRKGRRAGNREHTHTHTHIYTYTHSRRAPPFFKGNPVVQFYKRIFPLPQRRATKSICWIYVNNALLDAFAYLRKVPISFVMSFLLSVCLCISARLPLDGFSWNLVLVILTM
jgi:hypothetical protein